MPINYNDYPTNWHLISRFIRFYRAKNKCEVCGCENYKPHPVTGSKVVLTVMHLYDNPVIPANSFFNLKAACQRCHFIYDLPRHRRNRKYGRYHKRDQYVLKFNRKPKPINYE